MSYRRAPRRSVLPLAMLALVLFGGASLLLSGLNRPRIYITTPRGAPTAEATSESSPDRPGASAANPSATTSLPTAPDQVAAAFLDAWAQRRYDAMYALLARESKQSITPEQFTTRYQNITDMATIQSLTTRLTGARPEAVGDGVVRIPFHVEMNTRLVGTLAEDNTMTLVDEGGHWRIQWSPSLIFKDLTGDYLIRMFPLEPRRGSILDRQGRPLAVQGYVVVVGVVPGEIEDTAQVLAALRPFVQLSPEQLDQKVAHTPSDWFVPIAKFDRQKEAELEAQLRHVPGIVIRRYEARIYPYSSSASHIVGYISTITPEELTALADKGYQADDRLGRTGVEAWGEEHLVGKRGGKLAVVTPTGEVVKIVKEQPALPGRDIQLTIDVDIQRKAEQVLGERPGSLIVIDTHDNSILAMASYPRFDPNKFVLGFTPEEWKALNDDPLFPFQNRPASSIYPTGSVFKPITMAAAIESGSYSPDSTFQCNGIWFGLGADIGLRDWTPDGHGSVTLQRGITTSCNIVFYEIGKKLGAIDPTIVPRMARSFGLGRPTGVVGVDEASGTVPDPAWKEQQLQQPWYPGDSINLAIGQGFLEATPLQMANVYSTLATKGQLRRPLLVRKIVDAEGNVVQTYDAPPQQTLDLPPQYWSSLYTGMTNGASSPDGSAYYAFSGYRVPVASKTGSAENQGPNAHAWFGGFAPADNPRFVVLVMVEGGGWGSENAAPRGRQMFEFLIPNPGE